MKIFQGTKCDEWEYPGWGSVYEKTIDSNKLPPMAHRHQLVGLIYYWSVGCLILSFSVVWLE